MLPVVVIDHLDVLKKDNAGAREAIRWLEAEFHKGSRLVVSLPNVKIQYCYVCGLSRQHQHRPPFVYLSVTCSGLPFFL